LSILKNTAKVGEIRKCWYYRDKQRHRKSLKKRASRASCWTCGQTAEEKKTWILFGLKELFAVKTMILSIPIFFIVILMLDMLGYMPNLIPCLLRKCDAGR
jgi:hypothetical protein